MRAARAVVVALALTMTSAGCASPGVSPTMTDSVSPPPSPSTTPTVYSGTGPTSSLPGIDFPIPADARSVVVTLTCEGGGPYAVELGDSMSLGQAVLKGTCDGAHDLASPITERTSPDLAVFVFDGVAWTAQARFSTEPFAADDALSADCAAFSDVYSALWNADQGYTLYAAFDQAEWESRVQDASADLDGLAAESSSPVAGDLAALSAVVDHPARVVGAALPLTDASTSAIMAACDANQTPVVISAEFGG